MAELKTRAQEIVQQAEKALVELSHQIHGHPETSFEEERASAWCADSLASGGFTVETGVADLPTAFTATAGSGPLTVGICAEYDALPGIGHACGHNVIAASAVGAGLALASIADELGITVKVFGTPAEEGGGGKIYMLDRGVFDGVHLAMMVHPAPVDQDTMHCLAVSHFEVRYTGKDAHASAFPELGINAADALTVAQVGIGLLRQQARRTDQVHGIVTRGGDAPNIIPAHTEARYYVRAKNLVELSEWEPRVHRCFEAGALATGAQLEIEQQSPAYSEMKDDHELRSIFRKNAEALGRTYPATVGLTGGSTDMANVSLAIPTIHPMIGIDSRGAVNHQPEFTAACATPSADRALVDGAVGMAWTVIDAARTDTLRNRLLNV